MILGLRKMQGIKKDDFFYKYNFKIEDIFDILDGVGDTADVNQMLNVIKANRHKLNDLLLDIFGSDGLTEADLRNVKIKELVPLFIDLFTYVTNSFKSKN